MLLWWQTDSSGRTLLNVCYNHNFRIANRKTFGDRVGNYTCYKYEEAKVVDFLLIKETFSEKVLTFIILTPASIAFDTFYDHISNLLNKHALIHHSHKKRNNSLETRAVFSSVLILTWNFGGGRSGSASTLASASSLWCS